MDEERLKEWSDLPATEFQKNYYELPENATFRDIILAIRADETIHRDVNHMFAELPNGANADQELMALLDNDIRIYRRDISTNNI